jgi:hypothetical protein
LVSPPVFLVDRFGRGDLACALVGPIVSGGVVGESLGGVTRGFFVGGLCFHFFVIAVAPKM